MEIQQDLRKAVALHQSGKLPEAVHAYRNILSMCPDQADALHLLGQAALQANETESALNFIRRSIAADPERSEFYNSLGNVFKQKGEIESAIAAYIRATQLYPEYADAYFNMGNTYQQVEKFKSAIQAYKKAIEYKPDAAKIHNNLGVAYQSIGKSEEALNHYNLSIFYAPDCSDAYNNRGNALKLSGRYEEAIESYKKAIQLDPECAHAYANLGYTLCLLGLLEESITAYETAMRLAPTNAEMLNDAGTIYGKLGMMNAAWKCYQRCASVKPNDAFALNNMGLLFKNANQYDRAIACYKRAIKVDSKCPDFYYNLGNVYSRINKSDEAVGCYEKALELEPEWGESLSMLIRQLQQACAWQKLPPYIRRMKMLTRRCLDRKERAPELPFLTFSISDDPDYNYLVAQSWANSIETQIAAKFGNAGSKQKQFCSMKNRRKDRIVVGYLSSDFKNHATSHLMLGLFGLHDRNKFKINIYSYGSNDGSYYRKKIMETCDHFKDISNLSDRKAAQCIFDDHVDILVELKGYTQGNRFEICTFKPAPIQVSYLGFPGTTGARFIDYIITDPVVTPREHLSYYSEKPVYLPHTYQVNDSHQEISSDSYNRKDFGLPSSGFVYCSFNEFYKIEPVMFTTWMNILRKVPGSVLWLMDRSETGKRNLKIEAEKQGIEKSRIIFSGSLLKNKHLARIKLADVALDTRIVNGHTTTSDALWAGVPVISLLGRHFASRVSASLLNAIGLPELVAKSLSEYQDLAVNMAQNPAYFKKIVKKLDKNRKSKPLFNTKQFVSHLEDAYQHMWGIYRGGRPPRKIDVYANFEQNYH